MLNGTLLELDLLGQRVIRKRGVRTKVVRIC